MTLLRAFAILCTFSVLSACTTDLDPSVENSGLGDFQLEHLVVVADDSPQTAVVSRKVSTDVLKTAVKSAVEPRLRRFNGAGSYSIGIKVQGYVLAHPGVPVLFAPRSNLFLSVNAYDDDAKRLNTDPRNFTIWEDAGGDTVVGSGYTQTAEQQLAELAANAAIEIELWLRENEDWFGGSAARPENNPVPATTEPK